MLINDDEQFEKYLQEFHPLAPVALLRKKQGSLSTPRIVALVAATAALLGIVVSTFSFRPNHDFSRTAPRVDGAERLLNSQPLTIRGANALLLSAPSLEVAIDEMSSPPQPTTLPKGDHSAIAALSKRRTKL